MIRLVKKDIVGGVTSYDVYFDNKPTFCSVIVNERLAPKEGMYRLRICNDRILMLHPCNGKRAGEITVGNGIHGIVGCRMHCGELVAGVLCVRGREWLEQIKAEIVCNGNELVVRNGPPSPSQREGSYPPYPLKGE